MVEPGRSGSEPDFEAAFDDIVARWSEAPVEPRRPTPPGAQGTPASPDASAPSLDGSAPEHAGLDAPDDDPLRARRTSPGAQATGAPAGPPPLDPAPAPAPTPWRVYSPPDPVDEDFVPPRPQLPDADSDPQFWAIVAGLGGGPLLLLALFLTHRTSITPLVVAGVLATVVGFVLLMRRGSAEPRDPYDDGARL